MSFRWFFFFVFLTYTVYGFSSYEDVAVQSYIDQYKDEAISEMFNAGIPASIKLAQGILESNAGRSELAVQANNHFGMKCGSSWVGPTYFKKDDDRNRRGQLIESCFRVFESPMESYMEHSRFLKDPKKEFRYGFLFDLDIKDYRSWAWGLKQAGYATNSRYAVLLIDIIERYSLFLYDYQQPSTVHYVDPAWEVAKSRNDIKQEHVEVLGHQADIPTADNSSAIKVAEKYIVGHKRQVNDAYYVYASEGQTLADVARHFDIKVSKLIKYNDGYGHAHQPIEEGEKVFLEKRKRNYSGRQTYHEVELGETMESVAADYGVSLKALLNRNHLDYGMQPAPGQRLKLKGGPIDIDDIPYTVEQVDYVPSTGQKDDHKSIKSVVSKANCESLLEVKEESQHPRSTMDDNTTTDDIKMDNRNGLEHNGIMEEESKRTRIYSAGDQAIMDKQPVKSVSAIKSPNTEQYHIVRKGETYYALSRMYEISIEELERLNNSTVDIPLNIGQRLRVK